MSSKYIQHLMTTDDFKELESIHLVSTALVAIESAGQLVRNPSVKSKLKRAHQITLSALDEQREIAISFLMSDIYD